MTEYWIIFTIGFFSSFGHCIGMCGGFVTAYTIQLQTGESYSTSLFHRLTPHFLYNTGRVFTYSLLGGLFGLVGETLNVIGGLHAYQGVLQAVAGVLMILIGLDMGGWVPSKYSSSFPGYDLFKRLIGRSLRQVHNGKMLGLGFVMGFIPCGLVYAAGAKAAASGGILSGMATMLFFGLGTFPALIAVGLSATAVSANFRSKVFKFATVLVIVLGIVTTYKGFNNASTAFNKPVTQEIQCH